MRIVIYGVGAIGGTLAARLALSGYPVVGIARGRQLDAIRERGLTLHTPAGVGTATFPVVADPGELSFAADDAILLTMKGQDTLPALLQLRAAGVASQPVFCFQNGVANEQTALRFFDNVYGATVMLPADYETPGEVAAYGAPKTGVFEVGRYPSGRNAAVEALCEILNASGFAAIPREDVMRSKYLKLLLNLRNIVDVVLAAGELREKWYRELRAEAEKVLTAAGIGWDESDAAARSQMKRTPIPGRNRIGNSTLQSVLRGTGSLETDYINGEIALLGRLHNMPAPVNGAFCRLSGEIARGGLKLQSESDDRIRAEIAAAGNPS